MIAVLDVQYDDFAGTACAAAVLIQDWSDTQSVAEYLDHSTGIENYVPGEFYKREMPCLLAILGKIREPIATMLIDGYVTLGDKPGLGMRLWEALGRHLPIVGVAKTRYQAAKVVEVIRGASRNPLFVTAIGMDTAEAANQIVRMAGSFRIPAILGELISWRERPAGGHDLDAIDVWPGTCGFVEGNVKRVIYFGSAAARCCSR